MVQITSTLIIIVLNILDFHHFLIFYISQGSVATQFGGENEKYCKFLAEFNGERI